MLNFFPYEIQPETQQTTDAGMAQIKLPKTGNMTALDIYAKATNYAGSEITTHNLNDYIFEVIKKIEVIGDGVDKILSLDGPALWKYLWWVEGACPKGKYYGFPGWSTWVKFRYPFGRYFGDKEYSLNLAKYGEVRCDVTYDLARKNTIGSNGYTTASLYLHPVGHITPPGKTFTSRGCRRVIERKATTGAASGDDYWNLVQDYPYLGLGLYARKAGSDDELHVTNVKLDLGAGKPVLYDYSWREMEEIMNSLKRIDSRFNCFVNVCDNDQVETWVGRSRRFAIQHQYDLGTQTSAETITDVGDEQGDKYRLQQIGNTAGARSTWAVTSNYTRQHIEAEGYSVGSFLFLPLADLKTWEDPLSVAEAAEAVLYWSQGAASTTIYAISEQIIPQ